MTQDALDLVVPTGPSRAGLRDRVLLLRSVESFFGLDEEALTLLAEQARSRLFRKGDVLVEEGSAPESIHVIVDGQVSITQKRSPLVMIGVGGGVGVLSVIAGAPNRRAVAEVDTRTLEVPRAAFNVALEESFSLLRNSLRMMTHQMLRSRGCLPADPAHPPAVDLGVRFEQPKTFAQRLVEFRAGLFSTMNLDAVVDMTRSMVEVRVPAGHVFWSVADPSTSLLHVGYGRVRCTAADGTSMAIGSNFTLGVMDVLAAQPRSYEARTETDAIAYRMDGDELLVLLEMHVQVGLELLRDFAKGMLENE